MDHFYSIRLFPRFSTPFGFLLPLTPNLTQVVHFGKGAMWIGHLQHAGRAARCS